jgi:hypothetical protein
MELLGARCKVVPGGRESVETADSGTDPMTAPVFESTKSVTISSLVEVLELRVRFDSAERGAGGGGCGVRWGKERREAAAGAGAGALTRGCFRAERGACAGADGRRSGTERALAERFPFAEPTSEGPGESKRSELPA